MFCDLFLCYLNWLYEIKKYIIVCSLYYVVFWNLIFCKDFISLIFKWFVYVLKCMVGLSSVWNCMGCSKIVFFKSVGIFFFGLEIYVVFVG